MFTQKKTVIVPEKGAFIRDDALILHFETAETPFVARFDLDSLAQANFEVSAKDNQYVLLLRDFSGEQRVIGNFTTKADAHQALHAILQALLSYNRDTAYAPKKSCWFMRLLKWIFMFALFVALAYGSLILWARYMMPVGDATMAPPPAQSSMLSTAPEGEAVDADAFLSKTPAEPLPPEYMPRAEGQN